MVSSEVRRTPSLYPFPTTYLIAALSLLSAAVNVGILAYFIYYLRMDDVSVPGLFIYLLILSVATLVAVGFVIFTHAYGTMSPRASAIINATLLAAWLAGLAWISSKIGHMVLSHSCEISVWQTPMGMMVCRIYKALYAFLVISTASEAGAVTLDYTMIKQQSNRGAYREMKDQSYEKERIGQKISQSGLRRGFYMEMKDSPDLSKDDDGQRLVAGESPEMSDISQQTPYTTPKL